jgi:uncharacterized protein YdhG (YjbR/CyaY superfamily)
VNANVAGPKGNLRFRYDEPLPLALISRIVRRRLKQDNLRAKAAARKRPGRKT